MFLITKLKRKKEFAHVRKKALVGELADYNFLNNFLASSLSKLDLNANISTKWGSILIISFPVIIPTNLPSSITG